MGAALNSVIAIGQRLVAFFIIARISGHEPAAPHEGYLFFDEEEKRAMLQELMRYFAPSMALTGISSLMFWLIVTVITCRLTPKIQPPADYSVVGWRAQLAALKIRLVASCSSTLGDAGFQSTFFRLCGAKVGRGTSMADQSMLPETVSIGNDCFFASGNFFTSMVIDQGRMYVPTRTSIGDNVFLGNMNVVVEGLPSGSFAGHNTFLPRRPPQAGAFFGNPAMSFQRIAADESESEKEALSGTVLRDLVYHFRTSLLDPFFWEALKTQEVCWAYILGQYLFPTIEYAWHVFSIIGLFAGISLTSWFLMAVLFCNCLNHSGVPLKNHERDWVTLNWSSKYKIRTVFKSPFRLGGTMWCGPFVNLSGGKVGQRFFTPVNGDELLGVYDAPFVQIGDDVTMNNDCSFQNHSFEDSWLKFVVASVGDDVTIMQYSRVACCDCGNGVVLRPASVTWKGEFLESYRTYEGAPAKLVDAPATV